MSPVDSGLLHPDEALRLVLDAAPPPDLETVEADAALGRVLSAELRSPLDHPPFDKSAMDGFAWLGPAAPATDGSARGQESPPVPGGAPGPFAIARTVMAGQPGGPAPGPGECVRIMTGAPMPRGCGWVQRVEWTEGSGSDAAGRELVRWTREEGGRNVIERGENMRAGGILLGPRVLSPQDLGLLASSGIARIEAARRPVVGVVSTGDELEPAGKPLGEASIHDSNGPALVAQARAAGADARFYGIVRDEEAAMRAALGRALAECDVLILSGGVSMGERDFVPLTLEGLGVRRVFHKVAMRPGKPTWFGTSGRKAVFGLPGNPVSTFVNFEVLVRPHLLARMGLRAEPRTLRARLGWTFERREADRVEFVPARLSREPGRGGEVALPLGYRGSSMLSVLAEADCLVRIEAGAARVPEGELVDARLVRA